MKKYLILFVSIVLVSCETKTVEVPVVAGEQFWGDNQGEGFVPGPKEDLQTALDILYGYADAEFDMISEYTYQILFCIPLMVWSRINIIFSRALNFEINLTKTIIFGAILSYITYFLMHSFADNPAVLSIIISQILIAVLTPKPCM